MKQKEWMAVKRQYTSELREAQSRATRQAVVEAAARLFVRDGYGATTIDSVAQAAGVSRKTVFNTAGGKVELLRLAIDRAVVGDDDPKPLLDRPEIEHLGSLDDPCEIMQEWAALTTAISGRLAALSAVLAVAAGVDPAARALQQDGAARRATGQRAFIEFLVSLGALRRDLDEDTAVDLAWFYSDPQLFHRLVHERQWTPQQFERWLCRTAAQQLLDRPGAA